MYAGMQKINYKKLSISAKAYKSIIILYCGYPKNSSIRVKKFLRLDIAKKNIYN